MARTEVIPVEKDESIQGLIKKMRDSLSTRIIIFSDKRVAFLRNEINLRLLKYYSEEESKELVLVVKDRAVRKLARRLGIEVNDKLQPGETAFYQNHLPIELEDLATEAVPAGEEEPMPVFSPASGGRLAVALVFTFFSLVAAAYFLLRPKIDIIIHPTTKEHIFSAQGTVGIGFGEREVLKGVMPIKTIEKEDELAVSISTTGRKRVGYTAAKGTVIFINSGTNQIIVPKGTVVSTKGGVSFATTKPVVVPRKQTRYEMGVPTGETYGQVEVEVEALEKGTIGNVDKQTITRIEGHLANTLHVVNSRSFTTGEDRLVPVVEEEDIRRAEDEAKRQLALRAEAEVRGMVEEGYILLPELTQTEVGMVRPEQPVGTESSSVGVKLSYKIRTALLSKNHLYKWLEHNLQQTLPAGFLPVTNEIACREIKSKGDLNQAEFSVVAMAKVRGKIDRQKVFQAIAGKPLPQAKEALATFPEVGLVEFSTNHGLERIPRKLYQVRLITPSEK
ncbi:MAG: hypothetical protein GX050_00390 [Firmicutes bacterium]|nr:hypothetical protein [Bacillota bacterium]